MSKKFIIFLLFITIILFGCVKEEEKYTHLLFDESISPYIIIKANTKYIYNFEDKKEKITTFDLDLDIASDVYDNADFELKVISSLKETLKYRKNSIIPNRYSLEKGVSFSGNGVSKFILKIKDLVFYEEVIKIDDGNVKPVDYLEEFISNDLSLDLVVSEDDEKYILGFNLSANDNYHIDMQCYLVDNQYNLYSFLGVYNYYRNSFPLTVNNNYIYKDINIEYLYVRVAYYDENTKNEVLARFSLGDIKNKILD